MSKISELGPITGANTRTEDLFVIVNLIQGDDGTKNISRRELVSAIQYEIFDRITITGGSISNVVMFNSTINNVEINDSVYNNGFMTGTAIADVTIDNSDFSNGTGNNDVFTNSFIDNSDFSNGTGNNNVFTDSQIDNSIFNNVTIYDGTANNLILTNITIDDVVITNAEISNSEITTTNFSDGTVYDTAISNSSIVNTDLDDVDITNSRFSNGQIWDTLVSNSNITNSDFSDGTGNNNIFTNTTIEQGTITNSEISNSAFTGTMDNVVANNLQITSSTADGLSQVRSTFDGGLVTNSDINKSNIANSTIEESSLVDFDMNLTKVFEPKLDEDSYFALKNVKTGETEKMTYRQLYDEVSRNTEKALKVHVASDGNDAYDGTILKPVKTLQRAADLALEKAGGVYDRNDLYNAVHISVGPGSYYVDEPIALPDDCSMTSTAGQYATVIVKKPGYQRTNGILVGSGCYVQGFGYMNFEVDNFDYPEGGFAIAYRPGALLRRSPYIRDSSQLSNFNRLDVEPLLNPFNSKGGIEDLGQEFYMAVGHSAQALFEVDDEVTLSSGASGYISYITDIDSNRQIYIRNLKGNVEVGDVLYAQRGGFGTVETIGIDDFPNRAVGRGGGCVLCDRALLDTDSLFTYLLCFGFTPRTQNGTGYVAKNGAGINGIGSLSIFARQAFYALNGGQMTLNNSGTQFGDISMRAKGFTTIIRPAEGDDNLFFSNTEFGDAISDAKEDIINDMVSYLTSNTSSGGLGYQGYNADKCFRDTGIIIDMTGRDIATDSNYWGRLSGITYRSPISYVVVNEQLTETTGSIEHLRDDINDIFANANNEVVARVDRSLNETLNILQNGEPNASPIIFANTGDGSAVAAREVLQDNRDLVIETFVDWLDNNEEFYAYDSSKCKRDVTEYIMPAIKYDSLLDTNYNSITSGYAYYFNAAKNVIGAQRNETVAGYERLRKTTDELVEANSALFATDANENFNEIIDIISGGTEKYTPTAATYDSVTATLVITIGTHVLTVGRYILLSPGSFVFSCDTDGNVLEYAHPRLTDVSNMAALPITAVTATTITVSAGNGTGYAGVHTLVSVADDAVSVLGSAITFSDSALIAASKRNARKQLQTNRAFIQDYMMDWAENEWFFYDSKKCQRDTKEYIVPAILRDTVTGTNFNSIQSGIAYRAASASVVVNDQLTETIGAIAHIRDETVATVSDPVVAYRIEEAYNELIGIASNNNNKFTPTDAIYNPVSGDFELVIGAHDLPVGKWISIADESITLSCANTSTSVVTEISHPRPTEAAYREPVRITAVTSTSITVNVGNANGYGEDHTFVSAEVDSIDSNAIYWTDPAKIVSFYTPVDMTYNPSTGESVIDLGPDHGITTDDYIEFKPNSVVFSCANTSTSAVTEISHPRIGEPNYLMPLEVTAVTANTITITSGGANGYTGSHTFVSAEPGAVTKVRVTRDGVLARKQLQTNKTFLQDEVDSWIRDNYFVYQDTTCSRDVGLILDAVRRDVVTGSNVNSVFAGLAYRSGNASTELVVGEQLTETVGAINWLKEQIAADITSGLAATRANAAFEEIIDITVNGTANADVISFGTNYVSEDALQARQALQANRSFLVSEVTSWIANTHPELVYDTADCERDLGYFIDAISWDVQHGSNAATINNTRLYFDNAVGVLATDEKPITAEAYDHISYLAGQIVREETVTAESLGTQVLNAANNALTPTDVDYNPVTGVMEVTVGTHDLVVGDYIVIAEAGITLECGSPAVQISHPRATDPYFNTPILIDAVTATTLTLQVGTAQGYTGAHTFVSALPDAVRPSIAPAVSNEVVKLFRTVSDVVGGDAFGEIPAIVEPKATIAAGYDSSIIIQTNKIAGNTVKYQSEVIDFIRETYNGLAYNTDLCYRDIGLIVDAISEDVEYGGNAATVNAASYYFANAINILPYDQREPTRLAYEHLADVAEDVITNAVVTPTAGNVTPQDTTGTPGSASIALTAKNLTNVISEIVNDRPVIEGLGGSRDILQQTPESLPALDTAAIPEIEPSRTYARKSLQKNRNFIQDEVVAYISDVYTDALVYNQAKCRRDVGYMVDAISHDVQYGGNAAMWNAAQIYFVNTVNLLPLDQREATKKAFTRMANVMYDVIRNVDVDRSPANASVQDKSNLIARKVIAAEAKDLALMVADIADDNNPTNLPLRVEPQTAWMPNIFITEKDKVDDDLEKLVISMINFISTEYNGISYSKPKCRRDVGIIIDALSHDVQYETNYATRLATNMYFDNATSVLPFDQRIQTADFYTEMSNLVSKVIQELAAGQNVGGTAATSVEGEWAADLVRVIEEAIRRDNLDALPELVEPNTSWVEASKIWAGEEIDANLDILADDLTQFIADNFTIIDYSKAKCRRDAGYIIDAMSYDLNYGGNLASKWNADFYFWNNVLRIPENTRVATAQAYRELGRIVSDVTVGKLAGQKLRPEMGAEAQYNQAYSLGMIYYNALFFNTPKALGQTIAPNFAWEENKEFSFAKQILENNKRRLQGEVQRFITSEYKFIDLPKTYRDGGNLIQILINDVSYFDPANLVSGTDRATRSFAAALFNIEQRHVFPVFNPPQIGDYRKLRFKGTVQSIVARDALTGMKRWDTYIVPTNNNGNRYDGTIYYWNGTSWITVGANNTDLLDSFTGAWSAMKSYINNNIAPDLAHRNMVTELIDNVLIDSVIRPDFLVFGSLVESIAHQFNGASAGVNRNALPLNFRNIGAAIGATASVLSEDGGRIRWSGSDELNNQYFARGLKINGRTGRIEGRPFTSSVRKLARRASNSRASL
jgi:uncharacterized protein YjbI with pentapeptide repeats